MLGLSVCTMYTLRIYTLDSPLLGSVFLGRDIRTGRDVALKLEAIRDLSPKLVHKYSIYRNISGISGIPKACWYRREGPYSVLVLDRLGSTFNALARKSALDTNTIFTYAIQMVCHLYIFALIFTFFSKLSILESLHNRHYVHLDIKPDNFTIGIGDTCNHIYLIDFGLAQLFRNPVTYAPFKGVGVMGTMRYSSINCHLGLTPSWRDDLESLLYTVVYLVKGSLPWQGIAVQPGQVHRDKVLRIKQVTTAKALCKGLPQPFIKFIQHIRSLGFKDELDYQHLRDILTQCVLVWPPSPSRTESLFAIPGQVGICT